MNVLHLEDINDLFEIIDELYEAMGDHYKVLWWRGHSDANWKLLPSVYRPEFLNHEPWLTQDFIRRAKTRYHDCPPENALPEWLILMQHHGLPTRLLDWSESIFVALYFAISEYPEKDGCVWVINPYNFNYIENNTERIVDCYEEPVLKIISEAFRLGLRGERIVATQMPENNPRMLVQQSAFTVHEARMPIEDLEGGNYIAQIIIPSALKPDLKIKLSRMGYTVSNLFPDLDHLAQDVKERHHNKKAE